jgi:hypothetical protein
VMKKSQNATGAATRASGSQVRRVGPASAAEPI